MKRDFVALKKAEEPYHRMLIAQFPKGYPVNPV